MIEKNVLLGSSSGRDCSTYIMVLAAISPHYTPILKMTGDSKRQQPS